MWECTPTGYNPSQYQTPATLTPRCLALASACFSWTARLASLLASYVWPRIPKANGGLLEEVVGRHSTDEDPEEVVGQFSFLTLDVEDHRFGLELRRVGIEEGLDLARPQTVFDWFRVAVLDPTELRAAVGEGSRFAGVTRKSYGRFDRTFSDRPRPGSSC